jgi:hypothetical protein
VHALLQVAGLVGYQDPAAVAKVLDHKRAQIAGNGVGVPDRGAQQALHPVGSRVARLLGQPPTVLALDRRQ